MDLLLLNFFEKLLSEIFQHIFVVITDFPDMICPKRNKIPYLKILILF